MENSDIINNDDDTKLKENDQNVDASEKRDEEEATTSRAKPLEHPEYKGDNMNDLKLLGINSADTVRQAMKAILSSKTPPLTSPNFRQVQIGPENMNASLCAAQDIPMLTLKVDEPQVRQFLTKKKQKAKVGKQSPLRIKERTERKRRQPRQELSNRKRKLKASSMYVGKLSNVMSFQRRRRIKSDSDMDSAILFY